MSILTQLRQRSGQTGRLMLLLISLLSLLVVPTIPANAAPTAQPGGPACILNAIGHQTQTATDLSANGKFIAYAENVDIPNFGQGLNYFSYNRTNHSTSNASLTYDGQLGRDDDTYTSRPALSADGRIYAFLYNAPNLLPNNPSYFQIYARDMQTNQIEVISQNNGVNSNLGAWNPVLSPDGRYVAFDSEASNLGYSNPTYNRETYLYDRTTKQLELISIASDGSRGGGLREREYDGYQIGLSADARYVAFTVNDLKGDDGVVHSGVFLRDRQDKRTYFIAEGYNPTMTPDARYIVFDSAAALLPEDQNPGRDLYLYDRTTQKFELITAEPNGISEPTSTYYYYNEARVSADGSQVVFGTQRPNLVTNDNNNAEDIFVRNRRLGVTERLSVNVQGVEGNSGSRNPSISADGRTVVFDSDATNLVPNGAVGVYVCQRTPAAIGSGPNIYMPVINR